MSESIWIAKRQRKHGASYSVRWLEPGTGKNRRKTFRRKEDARAYEAQLRKDLAYHDYHVPVRISYGEWVQMHLEEMRNSLDIAVAEQTINGHKEALKALDQACRPKTPLEITPKMIRDSFRRIQLEKDYKPRTINKHIAAIRAALSYAVRAEIIPSNKLEGQHRLFLPKVAKAPRILEPSEVRVLLNAATDQRHRTAISLAYYHGLRKGEIFFLQWQDVGFDQRQLNVVYRSEAMIKKRASRSVPLRSETADLLAQLQVDRVNQYVFEKPMPFYWNCRCWFSNLIEKVGQDHCTLHDLRKTCNTLMQDEGVPQQVAIQVLGHSAPRVNSEHYTGPLSRQQRLAIDAIPTVG